MRSAIDARTPAGLERTLNVSTSGGTLHFAVAAHDQGDWELRVLVDGQLLKRQVIDHGGPRWKEITVDLKSSAGRSIALRLENAANDWNFEFGYWANLELTPGRTASR